jgi:hypothetical protein
MALLTRDQILNADDLQTKDVYVRPWGGSVRIRTMTAHERDQFEQQLFTNKGGKKERMDDVRAYLVSMCVVDEGGNRLFSERDVKALSQKSANALDIIFGEAQKLNAVTDDDVEEIVGNSEETPGDSSGGE